MFVVLYRVAHLLYARGWRKLPAVVSSVNGLFFKATITPDSCIGAGLFVPHPAGILFRGIAGEQLTLYTLSICCATDARDSLADSPRLGDRVKVDVHSAVLGPVSVGDDARIGFRTVLTKDIPSGSIAIARAHRVVRPDSKPDVRSNAV
jgi:serine O-acetyltransferase